MQGAGLEQNGCLTCSKADRALVQDPVTKNDLLAEDDPEMEVVERGQV